MSKWVEVIVDSADGETAMARLWPGGVRVKVKIDPYQEIYMPGWRIQMQTGDMDGNRLERVVTRPPEYGILLSPVDRRV